MEALAAIVGVLVAISIGVLVVMYLIVPFFKGVGWTIRKVGAFVGGEVSDGLRIVGALLTKLILAPLVIGSILIGRWSAAAHYGRAIHAELRTLGGAMYRMAIGHPARLLCLHHLVDGLERRIPEVVAAAPTADAPKARSGQYEGYRIVGSLPGGGSGGKLYIAEPDTMKRAIFERNGQRDVRQVVIKTFSLRDGSSLPQIVRESRALDAAKRLGLVLEHELGDDRFYYVTRYVPGESLSLVTQRLHAMSGADGLGDAQLRTAIDYAGDLLRTLDDYHKGGLWHKDVKPDNIIVDSRSAHLVDFGLVTPLRSAMTLTTHGTEYFRDPELVRLALKGVKVHQVDGAKFDLYAAGAVIFSVLENSFPAHGGLSQLSKRCPEALRWVVRRAMTEYDKRYPTAAEMLADIEHIRLSADPFAVKPIELPSMRGAAVAAEEEVVEQVFRREPEPLPVGAGSDAAAGAVGGMGGAVGAARAAFGAAAVGMPGAAAAAGAGSARRRPNLRVKSWWSGGYVADDRGERVGTDGVVKVMPGIYVSRNVGDALRAVGIGRDEPGREEARPAGQRAWTPRRSGVSAKDQLKHARSRAEAVRKRARSRMHDRRRHRRAKGDFKPFNSGVAVSLLLFTGIAVAFFVIAFSAILKRQPVQMFFNYPGDDARGTPGVAYASGDLFPIDAAHPLPPAPNHDAAFTSTVVLKNERSAHPKIIVDGAAVHAGVSVGQGFMEGERVLVISDIQPPPPSIVGGIEGLRRLGVEVVGNYPGNPATGEEINEQMLWDAEAKMVRGLGQLESPDVLNAISEWLSEPGRPDALVWFGKGAEKDWVRYYVYTPAVAPDDSDRFAEQMARRTEIADALTASVPVRAGR